MNDFKQLKYDKLLSSVLFVIFGAILVLFPKTTASTICNIIAIIFIAIGIIKLIIYFTKKIDRNAYANNFMIGIILILIGIIIMLNVKLILSIIPFILGILITISGFTKMQSGFELKRMGSSNWRVVLVLAIINIILGFFLLTNPFKAAELTFVVVGLCMIYSGITDIYNFLTRMKKLKEYLKDQEALTQDPK